MFQVEITYFEYGDKSTTKKFIPDFKTYAEAELAMCHSVIDDLSFLNSPNGDGSMPQRHFSTIPGEEYNVAIVCWDGSDYDYVSKYKIVEIR